MTNRRTIFLNYIFNGLLWLFFLAPTICLATAGHEIGFIEDFALAEDRKDALKRLIPGTEKYYFYSSLHHQNQGDYAAVEALLTSWIKRYGHTQKVREIENRQALLKYDTEPEKSLAYLRRKLGVRFAHHKDSLESKRQLPSQLDSTLIERKTLAQRAFKNNRALAGFEAGALDWLIAKALTPLQRRHLLERIQRPDYPQMVTQINADLKHKHSRGFGAMEIHHQLLRQQLDALVRLRPALLNESQFVNIYLTKLQPNHDVDIVHDPIERKAYLDRLWDFVDGLAPIHNSLKAHVLFQRLLFDRSQGVYHRNRFMAYIRLPRQVSYINKSFFKARDRRHTVDMQAHFQATQLPTITYDETLVRSFLQHFFMEDKSIKNYQPFIDNLYLKHLFAETMIVHGFGDDQEQWYSLLPPAKYQTLKERIDLDFAPINLTRFHGTDTVSLDLFVKNVEQLIVKVYQINTMNYYQNHLQEISTNINLDGLVANHEITRNYQEPSLRRVRRTFRFPMLDQAGVYVIDFIGNGKSSRALVRKGYLHHIVHTGPAGQRFTILDEENQWQKNARLWLAGRVYETDVDGTITVPFSNQPSRQAIILQQGDLATLAHFQHQTETYQLKAGFHVERESLISGEEATVVVRAGLYLNGKPISLSLLKETKLEIRSEDHEGVQSSKKIELALFEDQESLHRFQVPDRLRKIGFTLTAQIQNISQAKEQALTTSKKFALNGIVATNQVEDLHLATSKSGYQLFLLGRSGEPRPQRSVSLALKHRDFSDLVQITLQTDAQGQIKLGALTSIEHITATLPNAQPKTWPLAIDRYSYPDRIHSTVGEALTLPYLGRNTKLQRNEFSLLELAGKRFLNDRFRHLSLQQGMLVVSRLPQGDYNLWLKESATSIHIRITAGEVQAGYVLGKTRQLEIRNAQPLQIGSIHTTPSRFEIQLTNTNPFTRVHLVATHFLPTYAPFTDLMLSNGLPAQHKQIVKPSTYYVTGRDIGDEYRYILNRKYAKKYPGNRLKRPELLLQPWVVRSTQTERQKAVDGEVFADRIESLRRKIAPSSLSSLPPSPAKQLGFATLDFLPEASIWVANLVPDEKGRVSFPRVDLGTGLQLHVLAVDPENTVYRQINLAKNKIPTKDLSLRQALPAKQHFSEQKSVAVLAENSSFTLTDITTGEAEFYDSIAKVYRLYTTLSRDKKLAEFRFILTWPTLSQEEKKEKYTKYACHELNFFLFHKDPDFFKAVIQPYLTHKRDKAFLDHWLLQVDLSAYLAPWTYARLNIVERILLGQRLLEEGPHTQRHVEELFDLLPTDVARQNQLFNTAIQGSTLDAGSAMLAKRKALRSRQRAFSESKTRNIFRYASDKEIYASDDRSEAWSLGASSEAKVMGKRISKARGRAGSGKDFFRSEGKKRDSLRQLYRKPEKTKEWAENNYYHLPITQQTSQLVTTNAFWKDYARHSGTGFLSKHLAVASRNFTEMMLAMAILELPFQATKHQSDFSDRTMQLQASSPLVVFSKEIASVPATLDKSAILVSQNFFREEDRYRYVHNEQYDKFVTDEFLTHTTYGAQVVLTNPTSIPQKLDVLLQIPQGALPLKNTFATRSLPVDLQAFSTHRLTYYFYFPTVGEKTHFPAHVSREGVLIAYAKPFRFRVVQALTNVDTESWAYVSQQGSDRQVLTYLQAHNIGRLPLTKIAFRMHDKLFFQKAIALLEQRHAYDPVLWSYSIYHNQIGALQQFLQHRNDFVKQCGLALHSTPLTIDPVKRHSYQHLEYSPLVNARVHPLGAHRQILNNRFFDQYQRWLQVLSYQPQLSARDLVATTYYMLLQDRVTKALALFARINPKLLATRLQYDYFSAYLALYQSEIDRARTIAARYQDYPVTRWRKLFVALATLLKEAGTGPLRIVDDQSRTQQQAALASTEPTLTLKVEAGEIVLHYRNLTNCQVNYYSMDLELLFSRHPFLPKQTQTGQFALIHPNYQHSLSLPITQREYRLPLPKRFAGQNVMIEVVGKGVRQSKAYYAHNLQVAVMENYGQLQVTNKSDQPLPKVYVKVYGKMKNGEIRFYKDGYTDLQGRFDYISLSTEDLDQVDRLALLLLSEQQGAVVREARAPRR